MFSTLFLLNKIKVYKNIEPKILAKTKNIFLAEKYLKSLMFLFWKVEPQINDDAKNAWKMHEKMPENAKIYEKIPKF